MRQYLSRFYGFGLVSIGTACLALAACDTLFPPTPTPDYTIKVVPGPNGMTAVPPACLNWTNAVADPYDNQPLPQFGCANTRNLAFMVDRPEDLIHGRDFGDSSGVMAVGAMRRYYGNQTRGLLDSSASPDSSVAITTASTPASGITGDATGSSSTSGSGGVGGGLSGGLGGTGGSSGSPQ